MRLLCENVATRSSSSSKTDTNRPPSDLNLATIETENLELEARRIKDEIKGRFSPYARTQPTST